MSKVNGLWSKELCLVCSGKEGAWRVERSPAPPPRPDVSRPTPAFRSSLAVPHTPPPDVKTTLKPLSPTDHASPVSPYVPYVIANTNTTFVAQPPPMTENSNPTFVVQPPSGMVATPPAGMRMATTTPMTVPHPQTTPLPSTPLPPTPLPATPLPATPLPAVSAEPPQPHYRQLEFGKEPGNQAPPPQAPLRAQAVPAPAPAPVAAAAPQPTVPAKPKLPPLDLRLTEHTLEDNPLEPEQQGIHDELKKAVPEALSEPPEYLIRYTKAYEYENKVSRAKWLETSTRELKRTLVWRKHVDADTLPQQTVRHHPPRLTPGTAARRRGVSKGVADWGVWF